MYKKSITLIFTVLMLVFSSLAAPAALAQTGATETPTPSAPQEATPPGTLTTGDPEDVVLFSQINQVETTLRGPYDSMRVRFSLPANWQLEDGAVIQLHLSTFYYAGSGTEFSTIQSTGATLEVTYNNDFLTSIALNWTGDNIVEIPIPAADLISPRSDGRHDLELFLDAAVDCQYLDHQTSVVVRESSAFILPHSLAALPVDLTMLPRPIYQQDAFLPGSATIVVPDSPSAAELQAALTVAAGFGRLSSGKLPISLVPQRGLTAEVRDNTNLIFVGLGSSFTSILRGVELPAPLTDAGFQAPGAQAGDGIIQEAVSPWNDAQLMLVVSGDSDAAVVKAAQAITSGALRTAGRPDLALVADVESSVETNTVAPHRSFGDLGYAAQSIGGIGLHNAVYDFFIPYGQVPTSTASLDLVFNSSALLDYGLSGMVIYLNEQVISSARFSDATTQSTVLNVSLPFYALRPGSNRISIEANLMPSYYCADLRLNNLWVNISPESTLHIPLGEAAPTQSMLMDLGYYPFPFVTSPTLDSMGFVLAQNDSLGWNVAASLAADLGRRSFGRLVELSAAYSDAVPEDLRLTHDLLVVGKASQHAVVAELNPALPAPYSEGSDMANESGPGVVYRLPEGTSVGYLQLATSPWNPARSVLAVMGSTDQGLVWAGTALTDSALRGRLFGNYAVVSGQQVVSTDTRLSAGTGNLAAAVLPTAEAQPEPSPVVVAPPPAPVKQTWIVPTLIVSGVLMVLVLLIALFNSLRGSRR